MPSGRLAKTDITTPATDIQLYAVPASKVASITVCMTNRTANNVKVRLALTGQTNINTDEYIAFDHVIYPGENYERSGIVLKAGEYVYVRSDTASVSCVVWGFEE
jgi:hypothetical protein